MTSFKTIAPLLAALLCLPSAWAQGLRTSPGPAAPLASPSGPSAPLMLVPGVRAADFIVAVVNAEPITNQQVSAEVERIRRQLTAQRRPLPDLRELARQVLDQLINDRAQLQLARDTGLRIDEP